MRFGIWLILVFCLVGILPAQEIYNLPDFEEYVLKVRKTFEVPGVSVAIVKDGEVILASGFGTKDISKDDPVDEETLFGIASNTKAFTATGFGSHGR